MINICFILYYLLFKFILSLLVFNFYVLFKNVSFTAAHRTVYYKDLSVSNELMCIAIFNTLPASVDITECSYVEQ